MSEQNKPFVVTDRRKFTADGEPRPDAAPATEKERHDPPPVEAQVAAEPAVSRSYRRTGRPGAHSL
jgi:hypothetical protein